MASGSVLFSCFPVNKFLFREHKKAGYIGNRLIIFHNCIFILLRYKLLLAERPNMSERINNTIKMKNKTFAMEAAPAAIPPNPKIAAIIATTINMTDQRSIKK
jgi:hypothetical protein